MKSKFLYILFVFLAFSTSCIKRRHTNDDDFSKQRIERNAEQRRPQRSKSSVKMTKSSGVYLVPCKINGTEMEFVFDTGASDITISLTEAQFLIKQGKLSEEDFVGTREYQIANGDIEEGTVVVLSTVEIGNRVLYNVEASIVHNMEAPLLLGQSALSKFGKISIDYSRNEIIFE